ncbi:MAG: acyl-CoA carboxylase subunit beta [Actinobacteria bacterium]|nr:acyl-CoA carboxylase subunit beta [Actinomycetota bacterium]
MRAAPVHQFAARPLGSRIDRRAEQFQRNRADMVEMLEELDRLLDASAAGGGPKSHERLAARGKMPVRERVALAVDRDSPLLELSPLAAWGTDYAVGAGMFLGVGVISGTECVILANDPSVLGGAMTTFAVKKLMRALEVARQNRMPYVQFVESAGADLRGDPDPERTMKTNTTHFGESGRMFYEITELSKMRIPTIAVVFGSSTAGGAYQPGMSDYNIFIRNQSKVFLGGPPLVKMATGEDADDETLGGAQMHCEVSGLGDYLAEDENDAIRILRDTVAHLHWTKLGPGPTFPPEEPAHDPEDLLGMVSRDLRQPVDVREVIARVVDGSRFEEFKARYGTTMVCGWATVHGFPVGILGNNGAIFPESAEKATQFIQLCNQTNTPLVFLQNITGYMVGTDFEHAGIVKNGSLMINAMSNSTVPHITVIIGASYGAGNYGMSGRAFNTRFTFLWPTAKIAVMGPKQMAGVMSIVFRGQAERSGQPFDEEADRIRAAGVEEWAEKASLGLYATSRVSDDGIIDPRVTRTVIGMTLSYCHNNVVQGAPGYGVFRP